MSSPTAVAYAGSAAFGGFWGVWGASVPAVRDQAGLSDGQLATALLFVGAGALPAMLLTGPAVDRWGHRLTAFLLLSLGGAGVAVGYFGQGFVSLSVGLAVLGATSGAVDVAINAAAGSAERASGHPVIARMHALFSATVVVASLATGVLLSTGSPVIVPFLLAAAAAGAAGIVALASARTGPRDPRPAAQPETSGRSWPRPGSKLRLLPLLAIGGLAAVALAVENAHQTWSAVYLGDVQSARPVLAATGPAVFAAVVALTRFAVASLTTAYATAVLISGAAVAAAGTAVEASAPDVSIALVGLGLAAAGTAVLYPTLLGLVAGQVDETARGKATSVVTTVAYLGFLAGPVYVGHWAATVGLPGAMVAVAAVAAGLALVTWPALRTITRPASATPGDRGHWPDDHLRQEGTVPIPFFKQTIAVLASGSDNDGVLGVVEVSSPRGAMPPLHVHHREDEAFYVIEGAYSVFIGDEVIEASPGTWVWGPRAVPHGYQIHSERGRHLSLTMPAGFETFFEEVAAIATPSADPRNEMSRLAEVAARYGVELLGPAPAST